MIFVIGQAEYQTLLSYLVRQQAQMNALQQAVATLTTDVNTLAAAVGGTSGRMRRLQTGFVRSYALSMLVGAVLLVGAFLLVRI